MAEVSYLSRDVDYMALRREFDPERAARAAERHERVAEAQAAERAGELYPGNLGGDRREPARAHPMPGQVLMHVTDMSDYDKETRERTDDLDEANVCTSQVEGRPVHKPVLDLDLPAKLVPSSTPGHSHLYLDVEMSWHKYEALLVALADAGILEPGYVAASIAREHTAVRLPWVRKPADAPDDKDAGPWAEVTAEQLRKAKPGSLAARLHPPGPWEPPPWDEEPAF